MDLAHDTHEPSVARLPWHRATTLTERSATSPSEADPSVGAPRLEEWTELSSLAPASGDPDQLDDRLRPLGCTAAELRTLLGETEASLQARFPEEPQWHSTFARWWDAGTQNPGFVDGDIGLLEVARPLLNGAAAEFAELAAAKLPSTPTAAPLVGALLQTLPLVDFGIHATRTMVLELNVARVQGRLNGTTGDERFASYVRLLGTMGEALHVWREYPVLARFLVTQLTFWIETRLELLDALLVDFSTIRAHLFDGADPGEITTIRFGAGDQHRRGRSVAFVQFDRGTVVFKPRRLDVDVAFDRVVAWVNARGLPYQLSRLKTIDRTSYGWAQFVDTSPTTDDAGADRYAWRLGAFTAILYGLHATDFHHENVMAAGEHPFLVDLEALLHTDKTPGMAPSDGIEDVAGRVLAESVQSVGVLPSRMIVRDAGTSFATDISAVGGWSGQLTPLEVPVWDEAGLDTMHLTSRRIEMVAEPNRPVGIDGSAIDLISRVSPFEAGFQAVHRLLQNTPADVLDGLLAPLAGACGRYIARATHVYTRLLFDSLHPDHLRDGLDRDRCLARLLSGHPASPERVPMIRKEVAELRQGDIPMFAVALDSGVLRSAHDGDVVGHRDPAPLAVATGRLKQLDAADETLQSWIIRSSFATSTMAFADAKWPNWTRGRATTGVTRAEFAAEALRLARRIQRLALRDGPGVGWIGMNLVDEKWWQLAAAPSDTYTGVAGIGHALDAVARVTADEQIADLARAVLDQVAHTATVVAETLPAVIGRTGLPEMGIGAFSTIGGSVYALAHAAVHHGRRDYAEAAAGLLPTLALLTDTDDHFDVVSGSAGAILALVALERALPGCGALEQAARCGRHLLERYTDTGSGWGWLGWPAEDVPLAGFSHGASGVAVALATLNAVRPLPGYVVAVEGALRYEGDVFDPRTGNWRDLRPDSRGTASDITAWCHGAPGIALARAELLRLGVAPHLSGLLDRERGVAVRTTAATGLLSSAVSGIGNHSLCHGDVGNLLILEGTVRDDEQDIRQVLPMVWRTLITEGRERGWLCGVPRGLEMPGLMTGIAGIAWGMARMAGPDLVPDVLRLQPPVEVRTATPQPAGRS